MILPCLVQQYRILETDMQVHVEGNKGRYRPEQRQTVHAGGTVKAGPLVGQRCRRAGE